MPIDYKIAAIPTHYKGICYRSRLEARWAAFFDLAKWDATYEPADLGAWSPDFLIQFLGRTALVEVKPITQFAPDVAERMFNAAQRANFAGDLILLGTAPIPPQVGWRFGDAMPRTFPTYWEFEPFGNCLLDEERVAGLWADASNAVQWKPNA